MYISIAHPVLHAPLIHSNIPQAKYAHTNPFLLFHSIGAQGKTTIKPKFIISSARIIFIQQQLQKKTHSFANSPYKHTFLIIYTTNISHHMRFEYFFFFFSLYRMRFVFIHFQGKTYAPPRCSSRINRARAHTLAIKIKRIAHICIVSLVRARAHTKIQYR